RTVVPSFYLGFDPATLEGRSYTTWERSLTPLTRVRLFDPVLPAERGRSWRDPPTDRVVAGAGQLRDSEALKSGAPQCLVWHLSFDRLRAMSDYTLEDSKVHTFESFRMMFGRSRGTPDDPEAEVTVWHTPPHPSLSPELTAELV